MLISNLLGRFLVCFGLGGLVCAAVGAGSVIPSSIIELLAFLGLLFLVGSGISFSIHAAKMSSDAKESLQSAFLRIWMMLIFAFIMLVVLTQNMEFNL